MRIQGNPLIRWIYLRRETVFASTKTSTALGDAQLLPNGISPWQQRLDGLEFLRLHLANEERTLLFLDLRGLSGTHVPTGRGEIFESGDQRRRIIQALRTEEAKAEFLRFLAEDHIDVVENLYVIAEKTHRLDDHGFIALMPQPCKRLLDSRPDPGASAQPLALEAPVADRLDIIESLILTPSQPGLWSLRGVTSNARYSTHAEIETLRSRQADLSRPEENCAALIPIRKSAAWWTLAQDEEGRFWKSGLDILARVPSEKKRVPCNVFFARDSNHRAVLRDFGGGAS